MKRIEDYDCETFGGIWVLILCIGILPFVAWTNPVPPKAESSWAVDSEEYLNDYKIRPVIIGIAYMIILICLCFMSYIYGLKFGVPRVEEDDNLLLGLRGGKNECI